MSFETPLAPYIPEAFKDSDFLKFSFNKGIVNPRAYILGIHYPRVGSLFIHSNSYAQVLLVMIPLIFFLNYSIRDLVSKKKYILRALLFTGLALVFLNLACTTDRTGFIGLAAGFIWWFFFWEKWPSKSKRNLLLTIIIVVLLIILCTLVLVFYFDTIIYSRFGSLVTRMEIYKYTIESLKDRPFFGWGVTRHIDDVFPGIETLEKISPLGTHSTYLGILYKQGIIGLLVFFWFLGYLVFSIGRSYRYLRGNRDTLLFKLIGLASWGFISNLVQGTFNMLDLISPSFHTTFLNISIIIAAIIIVSRSRGNNIAGPVKNG
jgi:O-antigen ligase